MKLTLMLIAAALIGAAAEPWAIRLDLSDRKTLAHLAWSCGTTDGRLVSMDSLGGDEIRDIAAKLRKDTEGPCRAIHAFIGEKQR